MTTTNPPAGTTTSPPSIWDRIVNGGASLTYAQVVDALGNSPLAAYAERIYSDALMYNVDPALFLAIAKFESDFGRAASSIWTSGGGGSYNWTSISNAAYGGVPVAGSRWGQYPTPEAGIDAFFKLITTEYYPRGQTTIGTILHGIDGQHAYAPNFENPPAYFQNLGDYLARLLELPGSVVTPGPDQATGGSAPGPTTAPAQESDQTNLFGPATLQISTPLGGVSLPNPFAPLGRQIAGIGSGLATALNTAEHDFWILLGVLIALIGLWLLAKE